MKEANKLYTFEDKISDEILLINGFQNINQLIIYTNNLQSQLKAKEEVEKEFIKYLEDEIEHNTPKARWKHYNDDGFNDYDVENGDYLEAQPVNITLKEVISKYKEILSKGENK